MEPANETAVLFKDYLPLVGVIVGGLMAIIGGFASNWFVEWRRNSIESKALAYAFRGELQALSSIARKRRYVEVFNLSITAMEQTRKPEVFHVEVRKNYFNVFDSNVGKIGILKNPLPELIAIFYVQANSVLEDLQSYHEETWASAPVETIIECYRELVLLMEDTFALADEIVEKIEQIYH